MPATVVVEASLLISEIAPDLLTRGAGGGGDDARKQLESCLERSSGCFEGRLRVDLNGTYNVAKVVLSGRPPDVHAAAARLLVASENGTLEAGDSSGVLFGHLRENALRPLPREVVERERSSKGKRGSSSSQEEEQCVPLFLGGVWGKAGEISKQLQQLLGDKQVEVDVVDAFGNFVGGSTEGDEHCDVCRVSRKGGRQGCGKAWVRGRGTECYKAALSLLGSHNGCAFKQVHPHNPLTREQLEAGAVREQAVKKPRLPASLTVEPDRSWDAALGGGRLAFGKPFIYETMAAAQLQCERENSRKRGWRCWAFDLPSNKGGAPKRYLAATVEAFRTALMKLPTPSAYEMIESQRPCWAYFDLECCPQHGGNADLDCEAMTSLVVDRAAEILFEENIQRIEVVVLDATRPTKFSQHVILRTFADKPAPLLGSAHAKRLAERVADSLGEKVAVATKDKQGCFVDKLVYTASRAFRLLGSTKLNGAVPLKMHKRLLITRGNPHQRIDVARPFESDELRETLVVPELEEEVHCLDLLVASTAPEKEHAPPQDHNRSSGAAAPAAAPVSRTPPEAPEESWEDSYRGATTEPLLDLADLTHAHIRCSAKGLGKPPRPFEALAKYAAAAVGRELPGSEAGEVSRWRYVVGDFPTERLLHLSFSGRLHCFSKGRAHVSQNCFLTADVTQGRMWQKCWDVADCSHFAVNAQGRKVRLYKKHALAPAPLEFLPLSADLVAFEREANLSYLASRTTRESSGGGADGGGGGRAPRLPRHNS